MNHNKILFICSWADKHIGLFDDLLNDKRVILTCFEFKNVNPFLELIRRIHISQKINRFIHFPYKAIWTTLPTDFSRFDSVLVTHNVLPRVTFYLDDCRKKGKQVNLFVVDAMDADSFIMKTARPLIKKENFDHIYTFEPSDVTKYGFEYIGFGGYYSMKKVNTKKDIKYDLIFSGGVKGGREESIIQLYQYLEKNECSFLFDLNSKPFFEGNNILYHDGWVPYELILDKNMESNCILEILQKGQTGPTLRYFEAVCYNKKLLTNNPHIMDFPFYNPKWMKIYHTPADINIEWLKERDNIDYGYNGEFSPTKIVDYLNERDK